jgi:hypothetical protein
MLSISLGYTIITILFEHICTRIVPELCPDMHRYEARKGDPLEYGVKAMLLDGGQVG